MPGSPTIRLDGRDLYPMDPIEPTDPTDPQGERQRSYGFT